MIEAAGCDAVLVVNHQTSVDAMAARVRASGHRNVLLVSSHLVFPHERAALENALAPAAINVTSLADWFTDAELAACDEATTESLRENPVRWTFFADQFEQQAGYRKNAAALAALRRAGLPAAARLYAADGLGICAAPWQEAGAARLPPQPTWRQALRRTKPGQACAYLRALSHGLPRRISLLRDGDTTYLFAGSLRRLALAPGIVAEEIPLTAALRECDGDCYLAVGLHEHHPSLRRTALPLRIFVDSFLPSNYPRTYFDAYAGAQFVCAEPISARWLRAWGGQLAPLPGFLSDGSFAPALPPAMTRTIVFLLGHAGDWTSLINRSDNDTLVAAALELANSEPDLKIILRLHPSMEDPRHEGAGAAERLEEAVRTLGRENVEFSSASLSEDLSRGDLLVAEYSAALIEGWRRGRPGLAVNLTRRRSFLQDFADLGFAHETGREDFFASVKSFRNAPAEFAAKQSLAALRYNELLKAHRDAC